MSNFEPGAYIESIGELVKYLEENEWIFYDGFLEHVDDIWNRKLEFLKRMCEKGMFQEANDPDDHF